MGSQHISTGLMPICAGLLLYFALPLRASEPGADHAVEAKTAQTVHPTRPLALRDLEAMALRGNPTLAQAAARVEAARGRAVQAGLYPNPTIAYDGRSIGLEGEAGQHGAFIDHLIVTSGKLRLNRAKFEHEAVQGEWQALEQQYRVLNGVQIRYYHVLAAGWLYHERVSQLQLAEEIVQATTRLVEDGHAKPPDLVEARIEARRAALVLEEVRNSYHGVWQELTSYIGHPGLSPVPLVGCLDDRRPPLDGDAVLAHLLEASPEIHAARAEVLRNQFALRREQAEPVPNLQVRAGTLYNFEKQQPEGLVRVGITLPVYDKNQGNIRSAQADLARSQAEIARVEMSLRERFAKAYSRYRTEFAAAQEYRDYLLPETRKVLDMRLESFRKKEAEYARVRTAQRDYDRAHHEFFKLLVHLRQDEVLLSGLLLLDGLEQPPALPGDGRMQRNERVRPSSGLPEIVHGAEGRTPRDRAGNQPTSLGGPP